MVFVISSIVDINLKLYCNVEVECILGCDSALMLGASEGIALLLFKFFNFMQLLLVGSSI